MKEAVSAFETPANFYQTTRRNNPEVFMSAILSTRNLMNREWRIDWFFGMHRGIGKFTRDFGRKAAKESNWEVRGLWNGWLLCYVRLSEEINDKGSMTWWKQSKAFKYFSNPTTLAYIDKFTVFLHDTSHIKKQDCMLGYIWVKMDF
jgi:hypothetical protein